MIILGLLLTPVVLKKELADLEGLTYLLFGSIGIFVLSNLYLLCFDQNFRESHVLGLTEDVWLPN